MFSSLALKCLCVSSFLASPAFATYWVDVNTGNDSNPGTAAAPFRTIRRALMTPVQDGEAIVVMPGVYSAQTGEQFPIRPLGRRLIGHAGSSTTILEGGIQMEWRSQTAPTYGPEVSGFTIRNSGVGIAVFTDNWGFATTLTDLRFENCTFAGVSAWSEIGPNGESGALHVSMSNVSVVGAQLGLDVRLYGYEGQLEMEDCTFSNNATHGAWVRGPYMHAAQYPRCRFENNGQTGFLAGGGGERSFDNCLFAGNTDGYRSEGAGSTTVRFDRCTLARNSGTGLRAHDPASGVSQFLVLRSCILYFNGDDLLAPLAQPPQSNDIEDGDFQGTNGNFSADPLFVDASSGDYRLRFGSPCCETGLPPESTWPPVPPDWPDLAGRLRPIDGNLDTIEQHDVGCFEFAPLQVITSAHLGSPARFEVRGAPGAGTSLLFARGPLVPPQSTPFGELVLNPATSGMLLTTSIPGSGTLIFQRPIPPNPLLVGLTFSFQSLTASSTAPGGSAYSNGEQFMVVP